MVRKLFLSWVPRHVLFCGCLSGSRKNSFRCLSETTEQPGLRIEGFPWPGLEIALGYTLKSAPSKTVAAGECCKLHREFMVLKKMHLHSLMLAWCQHHSKENTRTPLIFNNDGIYKESWRFVQYQTTYCKVLVLLANHQDKFSKNVDKFTWAHQSSAKGWTATVHDKTLPPTVGPWVLNLSHCFLCRRIAQQFLCVSAVYRSKQQWISFPFAPVCLYV